MSCQPNSWFYGLASRNITGTKYGTLTRITTPASLPATNCLVAYWVSCRSTTLEGGPGTPNRFYQATIAYTSTAGRWHFSWGYSPNNLAQPPYTGLYPTTSHNYELGIRFTGTVAEAYVVDLSTSIKYTMGTLADNGTMCISDNPGFLMESYGANISDIGVGAFKAYTFNVFTSPTSSSEWPNAASYKAESGYSIPSQIHTYDLGSHQYMIGNTAQGSQLANGTSLW